MFGPIFNKVDDRGYKLSRGINDEEDFDGEFFDDFGRRQSHYAQTHHGVAKHYPEGLWSNG